MLQTAFQFVRSRKADSIQTRQLATVQSPQFRQRITGNKYHVSMTTPMYYTNMRPTLG